MREYAKVSPTFWIGKTGKLLREAGHESQLVALYLMTCPHANMLGLFYCPLMFIAHETGITFEGASKGLRRAIEAGFCAYDDSTEMVWVYEMARYQIGDYLSSTDKRSKGVQNAYEELPANPYLKPFFEKYGEPFKMTSCRSFGDESGSPLQAPCKPLRSQEQEQEQEQDFCPEPVPGPAPAAKAAKPSFDFSTGRFSGISDLVLKAWSDAYPAVDVNQEIAEAAAWLMTNTKHRKSDYLRFLNGWMSREQDKARPSQQRQSGPSRPDWLAGAI